MVIESRFCNIPWLIRLILAVFLGFPHLAIAVERNPEFQFKGRYDCSFSGILFAHIGIEAEQDATSYAVTSDISSAGLLKLFVKHSSHSTVSATGKDFNYPNIDYESNYHTKKKKRYVSLTYRGGFLAEEKLVPPDNPASRPPVAKELKKNAADPLTFLLQVRYELMEALKNGEKEFILDVYDGRRLSEVYFNLVPDKRMIRIGDTKLPIIALVVSRRLKAGFTKSELEDVQTPEPPLFMYFSNDERLWPIRLEVPMSMGTMSATLVKECLSSESCLLGNKD